MPEHDNHQAIHIPDDIVERAIELYLAQEQGAPTSTASQWTQQDPLHLLAWQRIEQLNNSFAPAQQQAAVSAVLKHSTSEERRHVLKAVATFGIFSVFAAGGWRYYLQQNKYYAKTTIGQFNLPFADISANAQSSFYWHDNKSNQLQLTEGDIWLTTHQSTQVTLLDQQFSVAPHSTVWFNLWQQPQVQVQQGELSLAYSQQQFATNTPYQLSNSKRWHQVSLPYNTENWLNKKLVANAMQLEHVISYLNRYHNSVITVAPDIKKVPVSGVFNLDQMIETLEVIKHSHQLKLSNIAGLIYRLSK